MSLIVTRHTESLHNVGNGTEPTFAGNKVDSELTENGRRDALVIAEKIHELGGSNVIYHSSMTRSRQTAEIIAQRLEVLSSSPVALQELSGLEEVDGGQFTGKTISHIKEAFPEAATTFYGNDIRNWQFPEGENYGQVVSRLAGPLQTLRQAIKEHKKPVVVGHANLIKVLKESLKDDSSASINSHVIDMRTLDPDSTNRAIWQYGIDVIQWQD